MLVKYTGPDGCITVGGVGLLEENQKFEVGKAVGEALLNSKQHAGLFVKLTKVTEAKPPVSKPAKVEKPKAGDKKETKKG